MTPQFRSWTAHANTRKPEARGRTVATLAVRRRTVMTTLRYKLFGIGKLPGEMRAEVEKEGGVREHRPS